MEKKFTYVNAIDNALAGNLTEETVAKLNALKVSLTKKSANKAEKKVSDYDMALRNAIVDALAKGRKTCTELIANGNLPTEEGKILTTQKVSAAIRAMGDTIKSETEKGKTYFSVA